MNKLRKNKMFEMKLQWKEYNMNCSENNENVENEESKTSNYTMKQKDKEFTLLYEIYSKVFDFSVIQMIYLKNICNFQQSMEELNELTKLQKNDKSENSKVGTSSVHLEQQLQSETMNEIGNNQVIQEDWIVVQDDWEMIEQMENKKLTYAQIIKEAREANNVKNANSNTNTLIMHNPTKSKMKTQRKTIGNSNLSMNKKLYAELEENPILNGYDCDYKETNRKGYYLRKQKNNHRKIKN